MTLLVKIISLINEARESSAYKKRKFIGEAAELILVFTFVFMLWKALILLTQCTTPVVVVVSGSMEPAFYRGDMLVVTNYEDEPIRVGDVLVFNLQSHKNQIVHRVIRIHENINGTFKLLTKGDNNEYDDSTGLYDPGQKWLTKDDVRGKIKGYVPYFGYLTIILSIYRPLTVLGIGILVIFSLRGDS